MADALYRAARKRFVDVRPGPGHPHAILVRAKPGDHWECMCGRWWFDSDRVLTWDEVIEVVQGEWTDHVLFEDRYASPTSAPHPHTSPTHESS